MADYDDATPQLTVHTAHDDGAPLIAVGGELDLATAPQLSAAARAALEGGSDRVVFDLSGLRFMDSSGLRVLLEIANEAEVSVRAASDVVRRVIQSTGVDAILKLEG